MLRHILDGKQRNLIFTFEKKREVRSPLPTQPNFLVFGKYIIENMEFLYFSQKQLAREIESRLVIIECAGYVFWQLFSRLLNNILFETSEWTLQQKSLNSFIQSGVGEERRAGVYSVSIDLYHHSRRLSSFTSSTVRALRCRGIAWY